MKLKLGTRTSQMALYQAHLVQALLNKHCADCSIEIVPIRSERVLNRYEAGAEGKGVFIKKLDEALLKGEIDFSVNCMKDIPNDAERTPGPKIIAVLQRDDIRDALLLRAGCAISSPNSCTLTIGTSAPRRCMLVEQLYPHAKLKALQGSCDTRVNKMDAGEVDALILSKAGLERIYLAPRIHTVYPAEVFLPAIGAGVITLDALPDNISVIKLLQKINHLPTYHEMLLERAFVNTIQGDCTTPMGGYIEYENGYLKAHATVFSIDTHKPYPAFIMAGLKEDPTKVGAQLAEKILRDMQAK